MPRPRRKTERCEQVLRYLVAKYPPPFKVELYWEPREDRDISETFEFDVPGPRKIYINLDVRRRWTDLIHDLLHEYGHVLTWPVSRAQQRLKHKPHPPAFWGAYGEIYTDFFDRGGARRSEEY